jgi:hypothetical protein
MNAIYAFPDMDIEANRTQQPGIAKDIKMPQSMRLPANHRWCNAVIWSALPCKSSSKQTSNREHGARQRPRQTPPEKRFGGARYPKAI